MSFSYPLAKTVLADVLSIASVVWDVQRNDELSGTGDARIWQAELANPLWTADVKLTAMTNNAAKQVAALVRKLYGARESFYLYDPISPYPQSDPTGSIVGSSAVKVNSVGAGRYSLSLKGLPASYVLTLGDKLQIAYGSAKNYFGEVSESITANGSGVTGTFEVFPDLPSAVTSDDVVTLKKPACEVFIMPGSFNPGTAGPVITEGAGFRAMERRR